MIIFLSLFLTKFYSRYLIYIELNDHFILYGILLQYVPFLPIELEQRHFRQKEHKQVQSIDLHGCQ